MFMWCFKYNFIYQNFLCFRFLCEGGNVQLGRADLQEEDTLAEGLQRNSQVGRDYDFPAYTERKGNCFSR